MAGRSIVNQGLWLQPEVTPGTAATNAMKRWGGIKLMPGFANETQQFAASGYKVKTSNQVLSEQGTHTVETIQDFNSLLPILASVLTYDGATQPDVTNAPNAYEHTFHLEAAAADDLQTYTAIWGDSDQALEMLHLVFNSLGLNIQRGALTLDTSALSYEPTTGATVPSAGVTEIRSVPIPARSYDVFVDDTWAALGTTKSLVAYELGLTIGDKRAPDSPINSTISSFESLVENEDIEFSGVHRLGFDATAVGLITAYKAGAPKFIRVAATGAEIGTGVNYELEVSESTVIQSVGEIGTAPNSPVVTLPFTTLLTPDATSNNTLTVRLVNTVATL
jgi:hypothetical protein